MMLFTGAEHPRNHPDNANIPNVNRPETVWGTTISFLLISTIALSLRLWVRLRDHLWGWDDAFVLLAGLASVAGDAIVCTMPETGLGLHLWTLEHSNLMSYFKLVYSSNITYCASAAFIKLSILFQYLRLFSETASSTNASHYRLARRITIFLIVVCSVWGVAFTSLAIFPCNPIAKNWDPYLAGTCIGWGSKDPVEFFRMFVGHAASNMLLDLLVLLIPVPFLGTMRAAGKRKVGLITLFTLGSFVAVFAVCRMVSLSINRAGTVPVLDMTYHTPIVYIFSTLEVSIAISAASIPIFWPVIASLTTNKIWVVNEVEVRVEAISRDSFSSDGAIGLTEQGGWKDDGREGFGDPTRKVDVLTTEYDRTEQWQDSHHDDKRKKKVNGRQDIGS